MGGGEERRAAVYNSTIICQRKKFPLERCQVLGIFHRRTIISSLLILIKPGKCDWMSQTSHTQSDTHTSHFSCKSRSNLWQCNCFGWITCLPWMPSMLQRLRVLFTPLHLRCVHAAAHVCSFVCLFMVYIFTLVCCLARKRAYTKSNVQFYSPWKHIYWTLTTDM